MSVKANITKKIGDVTFSFQLEDETEFKAMLRAAVIGDMPSKCRKCKGTDVHLNGNKAKGFEFVKVICRGCNARAQLGQYRDGGYFWKSWEDYEPPQKEISSEETPFD